MIVFPDTILNPDLFVHFIQFHYLKVIKYLLYLDKP
jgi:hypothetical protein